MPQQTSPTATDDYQLDGKPLTLEQTAQAVGIGLSTLKKRRQLLRIEPFKGVKRRKFIRPEDVAFLQYMERHPYLLTAQLAERPEALEQLRCAMLEEHGRKQQGS